MPPWSQPRLRAQHLAEFGRSEDIRVTKRKASWLPDCGTANLTYMTCEHEEHVHESCQHQTTYLHEKLQILRDLRYRIDKSGKSKRLTHHWTKYGSVTATSGAGCLVQCFLVGNSDISDRRIILLGTDFLAYLMMCGCESRLGPWALDIQLGTSHATPGTLGRLGRSSGQAAQVGSGLVDCQWCTSRKFPCDTWRWDRSKDEVMILGISTGWGTMGNLEYLCIPDFVADFCRHWTLFRAFFCRSLFPQGLLSNWKGGSKLHKWSAMPSQDVNTHPLLFGLMGVPMSYWRWVVPNQHLISWSYSSTQDGHCFNSTSCMIVAILLDVQCFLGWDDRADFH